MVRVWVSGANRVSAVVRPFGPGQLCGALQVVFFCAVQGGGEVLCSMGGARCIPVSAICSATKHEAGSQLLLPLLWTCNTA